MEPYPLRIFLACACFYVAIASSLAQSPSPSFSKVYSAKGTLYIPYAEIAEPFYAWYDEDHSRSRIDYYGGMVKTYQFGKSLGTYGSSIKIAPVTTESQLNKDTCLQVNGSDSILMEAQSVVPDLTYFQIVGTDMLNGFKCDKWRLVDSYSSVKVNKYTLWTRQKNSLNNGQQLIPVRYEMKGFNSLLGSHYDHYYVDYEWYSVDALDPSVFHYLSPGDVCQSFPGPGENHLVTFNPMREFIHRESGHVEAAFEKFKKKHKKNYAHAKEHEHRHSIFLQNFRFIHSTNRAHLGYQLAVNHLADRTDLELRALRGKQKSTVKYNGGSPFPYDVKNSMKDVPEQFDWRLYGAVTPVKDQSVCGSCWSFGTTGSIEGAYFLKSHQLVSLSEQALIDCSWGYGNNGCDGGEDFRSYQWMLRHGGIPTEEGYGPYYGQDGYCHIKNITENLISITGYVNVTSGSADAMKLAVYKHGPISVAIDASHKTFSFYANGVYYDRQCGNTTDSLDHAVVVVGYGVMAGEPYWLVKNSWSTYWGNDGYVLMAQKDNNCGVTVDGTYVTM